MNLHNNAKSLPHALSIWESLILHSTYLHVKLNMLSHEEVAKLKIECIHAALMCDESPKQAMGRVIAGEPLNYRGNEKKHKQLIDSLSDSSSKLFKYQEDHAS